MARARKPTATRVARDPEIDSLSTEWVVKWPGVSGRSCGKAYRVIERAPALGVRRYEIITAVRRQPVDLMTYGRLLGAVEGAIYAAKAGEAQ